MSFGRSTGAITVPFALLVLVHCSSVEDDAEEGCGRMLDAVVIRQPALACGAAAYCAAVGKLAADGAIGYRKTELETCLHEIRIAPPCAFPEGWPLAILYRVAPACAATFGGTRKEGDRCASSIECGWTSVCKGEPSVCTHVPGVGERCEISAAGSDCQDGLSCNAPTRLVGDVGTCSNVEGSCSSLPPTPACGSAKLGETCSPVYCVDLPSSSAHSGYVRCTSPPPCGGGLVCDPSVTTSPGTHGKCVLPVTFR